MLVPAAVDSSTGLDSWTYIHAFGKLPRLLEYLQLDFNIFLAMLLVGRSVQKTNQLLSYDSGPWNGMLMCGVPRCNRVQGRTCETEAAIAGFEEPSFRLWFRCGCFEAIRMFYIFVLSWRRFGRCRDNGFVIGILDLETCGDEKRQAAESCHNELWRNR
jgi:hypothetical protein